jgi:hypothetical protein
MPPHCLKVAPEIRETGAPLTPWRTPNGSGGAHQEHRIAAQATVALAAEDLKEHGIKGAVAQCSGQQQIFVASREYERTRR